MAASEPSPVAPLLLALFGGALVGATGAFVLDMAEGQDVVYWLAVGVFWLSGVLTTIGAIGLGVHIARR